MKILSPGPCFLSPDQRAHECELRGGKAPYTSGARDGVSVCVCECSECLHVLKRLTFSVAVFQWIPTEVSPTPTSGPSSHLD